jgi:hypothetical protein
MTPSESDDLTHVVEQRGDRFVALRSPDAAEHSPEYFEMGSFRSREDAEHYLAHRLQEFTDLIDLSKSL